MYIQTWCLGFITQMGNFWGLVNIIKRAQTYLAAPVSNSASTWILWWLWNNSVILADLFALHFQWKWSRKKEKKKKTPQRKNRKLKIHPLSLCFKLEHSIPDERISFSLISQSSCLIWCLPCVHVTGASFTFLQKPHPSDSSDKQQAASQAHQIL